MLWLWLSQTAPLRADEARLFLNEPAPGDPKLYPSDHVGVLAPVAFASK